MTLPIFLFAAALLTPSDLQSDAAAAATSFTIERAIYAEPALLWEETCGLIDDREPAPSLRGTAHRSSNRIAAQNCEVAMRERDSIGPEDEDAFEEAVDMARSLDRGD